MTFANHTEDLTLQVDMRMCMCLIVFAYVYSQINQGTKRTRVRSFSTLSPQDDTMRLDCCRQFLNTLEMMKKQARPHTQPLL